MYSNVFSLEILIYHILKLYYLYYFNSGIYSIMAPRHSIPNMTVKRYCGENTEGVVLWENSTMPELFLYN